MASYEQLSKIYQISEELFKRTGKIAYYGAMQSAKELAMENVAAEEGSIEK
ncbi:MAG: hypothetical protein IJW24_03545 [Clostridia bacterium]|nr:hypothetical protein [Clostridia bacterium]